MSRSPADVAWPGPAAGAAGLPDDDARAWMPPVLVAAACVAWRLAALGALENDHFVHLARAHQVLRGDWPLRDFSDPGLPLHYLTSAAAAWLFGATPLTDALLHIAVLAVAAALTTRLASRATGSVPLGVALGGLQILAMPRLYGAPKLAVPVVAIALAWRYLDRPSTARIVALGTWLGIASLVRHDYGVYLGLTFTAVVAGTSRGEVVRRLGLLAGSAAAVLLPWAVYAHVQTGLPSYFETAIAFSRAEAVRTARQWPGFDAAAASPRAFLAVAALYSALAVCAVAAGLSWRQHPRLGPWHVRAAALLAVLCSAGFLRDTMIDRLPDVAGAVLVALAVVVGAWMPPRSLRVHRAGLAAAAAAVAVAGLIAGSRSGAGPAALLLTRYPTIVRGSTAWPWARTMPTPGLLPFARYVSACTQPDDRALVGWFAPEASVYARRRFAGGHPSWVPGYYTRAADRARIVGWLTASPPRVALVDDSFRRAWPEAVEALAASGLMPIGTTSVDGRVAEMWARDVPPGAPAWEGGLPCMARQP